MNFPAVLRNKNSRQRLFSAVSLSVLASQCAYAADEKSFAGDVEFGWIATSGNTETSSTKAGADLKHITNNWRHNYKFEAQGSESEVEEADPNDPNAKVKRNETTAELYSASMRNELKIDDEYAALFLFSSYEKNRFSGFDYQASLAAGYADRLFQTDSAYLDYRVGPGYSLNKSPVLDANGVRIGGDKSETLIVRVDLEYAYNLSENAKFEQLVASEIATESDRNTRTKSETSITATILKGFALKAAYTLTYNDVVPIDKKHADSQSSVTLVYSF